MKKPLLFLFVLCLSLNLFAQNSSVQNCIGGIQVCSPIYTQNNSYTGYGTINELFNNNDGCLSADPGEVNSVWYIITVTAPGILVFTITPNQPLTDYDWAMWDITSNGCNSIFNYSTNAANPYPPVRCNTSESQTTFNPSGVTGLSTTACCPSQGAGATNAFCSALAVTTGQVFALCLDNWTASTVGYTLNFSASTASIFDTSHPRFDTIGTFCGATDSISFSMSEAVKCTSLASNGSDFYITPTVATPILAAGLSCTGLSTSTTTIGLKFSSPLPPGNYVLHSQIGTDTNTLLDYCNDSESIYDSIAFTVATPPALNLSLEDTICLHDSVQFNCIVSNSTAGATYKYLWSPNQYMNNDTLANAKAAPPSNMPYVIAVTQHQTGCTTKDTVQVTVLPNDFTLFNQDTSICVGATDQVNISGSPFFAYSWSPASGVSNPNTMDPSLMPFTTTDYVVTATFPGCPPMAHSFNINVSVPSAQVSFTKATCVGTPAQFDLTVAGGVPYNYSWSPSTYLNNSSIPNPSATPTAVGDITYVVTVSPVAAGCFIFDSITLHVLPNDFSLFNNDSTFCIGTTIQINASGDTEFTYTWTPTTGVSNPNIIDPTITPDSTGTYTITASYPGCPNMPHQLNYTVENPIADILTSDTSFCIQDPVQIYANAGPSILTFTYLWTPSDGLSDPTVLQPVFFEGTPGVYPYYLTITTPLGCSNTDSITITTRQQVKLFIDPTDTTINYGSSFQINAINLYSEPLYYFWTPNNSTLDNPNIGNPIATPLDTVTYDLIAMNQYGCKDSGTVKVGINFAMDASFPNAFSPNGDGLNDVFRIDNLKYQKLIDFRVFNRWGNVVFHTTDPDKGWDGTMNGVKQPVDTYNYMVDLVLPDGSEKLYRGTVVLIR